MAKRNPPALASFSFDVFCVFINKGTIIEGRESYTYTQSIHSNGFYALQMHYNLTADAGPRTLRIHRNCWFINFASHSIEGARRRQPLHMPLYRNYRVIYQINVAENYPSKQWQPDTTFVSKLTSRAFRRSNFYNTACKLITKLNLAPPKYHLVARHRRRTERANPSDYFTFSSRCTYNENATVGNIYQSISTLCKIKFTNNTEKILNSFFLLFAPPTFTVFPRNTLAPPCSTLI